MDIILAQRLRELRSERKNTQEQLAVHLGITTQAVSKWERGEGLPDIGMLPGIASFYHVSVDHLLGVDQVDRQEKLDAYVHQSKLLKSAAERVDLWREAYREFPNESLVLHNLCFALRAEDIKAHGEEIITLAKRLLKEAKLSGEYFGAVNNLCHAYAGMGELSEAKRYAAMAGRYIGTENQLMIRILEGDEAAAFCQWNIETLMDLISVNAAVMLQKGTFAPEERIHIAQQLLQLFSTVYDDGCYGFYHCRVSKWYMRLAKYYGQAGDSRNTIRCLEGAMRHAAAYDGLEDGCYTAPIVNRQRYHASQSPEKQVLIRRREMADSCFDFVKETPVFQALLA